MDMDYFVIFGLIIVGWLGLAVVLGSMAWAHVVDLYRERYAAKHKRWPS